MESELVESHMRVVHAMPQHREYFHGGSPPEPVLAEAATRYLDELGEIGVSGPTILADACERGFVSREERGELCRRLLTTIAHDRAVRNHYAGREIPSELYWHRAVPVLDFLRALFAEDLHEKILKARPVAGNFDKTLEDAFSNAYVFFTRWGFAGDSKMLLRHNLAVALLRGMATQGKPNLTSIDAAIPVHWGDLGAPISPETTTLIGCQATRRIEVDGPHVDGSVTVPILGCLPFQSSSSWKTKKLKMEHGKSLFK